MKWLQEHLDLSTYKYYELDDVVLLVSDKNAHWIRVSPYWAESLKLFEGKTFKYIYENLSHQNNITMKELLPLLYTLALKNNRNRTSVAGNKNVFFVITGRCNLKCLTCYIDDVIQDQDDELTLGEIEEIFQQLKKLNFQSITISGGEPLIRKDIKEVLILANKYFSKISLNTNATLINKEMGNFLKEYKIQIMISLDGIEQDINDRIRGTGTHEKVLKAINLLKEIEHDKIIISTTVTGMNARELIPIYELGMQLGVPVTYGLFIETGRGRCNSELLSISTCDLVKGYLDMLKFEISHRKPKTPPFFSKCMTYCGAIHSIINIMPNGDVFPCPNLIDREWKMGNLRKNTLEKIIINNKIVNKVEGRDVRNVTSCKDCSIRFICGGGCMANAYVNANDIYSKDPMCDFYKILYTSFLNEWDASSTDAENIEKIIIKMQKDC